MSLRPPTDIHADLADAALEAGEPRIACGLLAIPDVIVVEGIANGLPPLPTDTPMLVRPDGRYVVFFREPGRLAA